MNNQAITQQDWQTQRRQARRLHLTPQAKETNWQAFKRQATEDRVTVTLIVICLFALGAVIAAQAGLRWNF